MLGQVALALIILLPFFWMVSVSLKPGDEPFAIPAQAVAGQPDAGELRHRLPARVPRLLPELDHRVAVDGGDRGQPRAARRLHLHPQPDAADPVPDGAGDRGADVPGERDHHPDLQDDEGAPTSSTPTPR